MNKKIKEIAEYYGWMHQFTKTIEEAAELIVELSKARANCSYITEDIITEIADVEIMLAQLIHLLEIKDDVEQEIENKLSRQIKRIEEEKERENKEYELLKGVTKNE